MSPSPNLIRSLSSCLISRTSETEEVGRGGKEFPRLISSEYGDDESLHLPNSNRRRENDEVKKDTDEG